MTKMFSFLTKNHKKSGDTINPLGGKCLHDCPYCWVKVLKKLYPNLAKKYDGAPHLFPKEFKLKFNKEDFVFVCDMTDLFGHWVPKEMIQEVLNYLTQSPAKFLLLTKFPQRYLKFNIPKNCMCGATIESNRDYFITVPIMSRVDAMIQVESPKMVSIEPIMDFDLDIFVDMICRIKPAFVAVGYDNYNNGLCEPELEKTMQLIKALEDKGIIVYTKTLREKKS